MKILVIWGESLSKPGGGTVHFLGLGRGLAACGHQVIVVTPRYGPAPLHTGGLETHPVRLPRRGLLSFLCFQMLSVLLMPWWLLRWRPDVVYVRTCFLQGLLGILSRIGRAPLVGEVDGLVDVEMLMRGQSRLGAALIRWLDHVNNRLSDGLVCVTRDLKDESIRRGSPPLHTAAIPNGAMTDVMRPGDAMQARQQLGLPQDATIVGFAGTFAAWQGLDFLLAAAESLKSRPDVNLKIALMGDGQMRRSLQERIASGGMAGRFILLPPGPHEQVATFLNACDASVIPRNDPRAYRFGSPLKFWDSISIGLPVFVPRGSDLRDVLDDLRLPGTFDPQDPASLAQAMVQLADQAALHRARRQEVHAMVEQRYSWLNVSRQVAEMMQRLLASRGRRS